MVRDRTHDLPCAVCGIETKRHSGWYLVMENCWVDRVKVLSWHQLLAREGNMRGVCGKECLKTILTHWLNHANLQLMATGDSAVSTALNPGTTRTDDSAFAVGRVVGELAVERESFSQVWTGSPEAMECILNALIGGMGNRSREHAMPMPHPSRGYAPELAFL